MADLKLVLILVSIGILAISAVGKISNAIKGDPGKRLRQGQPAQTAFVSALSSARVLCYGDSLTAGTSPPLDKLFPYGAYLEKALNDPRARYTIADKRQSGEPSTAGKDEEISGMTVAAPRTPAVVRWRGLPGWTSSAMLQAADDPQAGLRSAIRAVRDPSLSLVIILAGTNDLAFEEDPQVIIDNVIALHKMSHLEGIRRTIAIGVPPSAWQASNEKSRTMASKINEALEEYCTSTKAVEGAATSDADVAEVVAVASYFPFPFGWSQGDSNWSPVDGLHLSPEGYAELGTRLAPFVSDVLSELQSDIQLS
eukprot:scaffold7174_cov55-Attheya_sp.AAC.1